MVTPDQDAAHNVAQVQPSSHLLKEGLPRAAAVCVQLAVLRDPSQAGVVEVGRLCVQNEV